MPKDGQFNDRTGWLRASVLGANDGIVSTASLLLGVISAGMDQNGVLLAGLAGLTAGAFSMAAGEYVSVSAQSDSEAADLARELQALQDDPDYELEELAQGLQTRGVSPGLAMQVAHEMTDHNALDAHAREELGIIDQNTANPLQAAWASALSFAVGAGLPMSVVVLATIGLIPPASLFLLVTSVAVITLMLLGGVGAWLGGALIGPAVARSLFWGGLAMAVTTIVGLSFGALS